MMRTELSGLRAMSSAAAKVFVLALILVAAAVGVAFYSAGPRLGGVASGTTVTSTTATSCTSRSTATSSASSTGTTTTASTVTSIGSSTSETSTVLSGSYASSSNTPVRVDSVQAVISPGQPGSQELTFRLSFTNVGPGAIYVVAGCGSSLNSTITSGAGVVKTTSGGARCLCAEYMAPVDPGQGHTSTDPGCWSGYGYLVVGTGGFSVALDLYWSGSPSGPAGGHLRVVASFVVP